MKEHQDIIAAKEAVKGAWLGRSGVTGMDVGFKYVGGKRTEDVAVRLFVRKKLAKVAPTERFPKKIGKHKTDVIEREFKPVGFPPDFAYYPTVEGGIRIWSSGWATTAGMFVRDNDTGQLMILGTFHGHVAPNSEVFQPSSDALPANEVAQIGFIIRNARNLTPPLDADLILYGAPRPTTFSIAELGLVNGVLPLDQVILGMEVRKRGVFTGVTYGTVDGISGSHIYSISIPDYTQTYPAPADYEGDVVVFEFMLTFAVDPYAKTVYSDPTTQVPLFGHEGDSGSIIVDNQNNAVAMLVWGYPAGGDGAGLAVGGGPPISLITTALNVTPCINGTILPRQINITSKETATSPPQSGPAGDNPPPINGDWAKSISGVATVKPFPICRSKTYRWTITNVYQNLEFRATVVGFDQPVFLWKINGQPLNDFNKDADSTVSFSTLVTVDTPGNAFPFSATFRSVKLSYGAFGEASYDIGGTYSSLIISPTAVDGHISIAIEVEVRDLNAPQPKDPNAKNYIAKSAFATLDTQELAWEGKYYVDGSNCLARASTGFGNIIHPWTLINLLLTLPDPPAEAMKGLRFVTQLGMELAQLAVTQPEAANKLTQVFAQTLNVPKEWLSGHLDTKTGGQ
jgi:hypothetical protein